MAKEYEIIDIWIGTFPTKSALAEYLAETYTDDDSAPISRLAADMGQKFYDHDFLEHSFHLSPSSDIRARLGPHSFSRSYVEAAAAAFESGGTSSFNTILLVWGKRITHPSSVQRDDYRLQYLGRFACAPGV
jgi:hypothetical protein